MNIPPSELLSTNALPSFHSGEVCPDPENDSRPETFQNVSNILKRQAKNALLPNANGSRGRLKSVAGFGVCITLLLALIATTYGISGRLSPESIIISWPNIVDTHSEYVSGKLVNFSEEAYPDISIGVFVKPANGDTKYWLDIPEYPPVLTDDGQWYQKCRFGDEDIRSMKKSSAPEIRSLRRGVKTFPCILKSITADRLSVKDIILQARSTTSPQAKFRMK